MNKRLLITGATILVLQLCIVPPLSARMYTWIDRNGVTRRTYYPPPPNQVMKKQKARQGIVPQKKAQNQVELYVTSWCPYCKKAQAFFRSRGIKFTIYDIEKDPAAAARKKKLDGRGGVPFAVINGKFISGYAPDQYNSALR